MCLKLKKPDSSIAPKLLGTVAIAVNGFVCVAAVTHSWRQYLSEPSWYRHSFHVQFHRHLVRRTFQSVRSLLFHHGTAWLHPPNPALTSISADIREDGCEVSDWDLKNTMCFAVKDYRIYSQCWLRLGNLTLISCWKGLPYNHNKLTPDLQDDARGDYSEMCFRLFPTISRVCRCSHAISSPKQKTKSHISVEALLHY